MREATQTLLKMASERFGVPDAFRAELMDLISGRKPAHELDFRLFGVISWGELSGG